MMAAFTALAIGLNFGASWAPLGGSWLVWRAVSDYPVVGHVIVLGSTAAISFL